MAVKRQIDDTSCLMLISRVGEDERRGEEQEEGVKGRVYICKTCSKEFSSFQALGGHRASHTKPFNNNNNTEENSLSGPPTKKAKTTSHTCPICGLDFPMGQALGGHMRKHRNEKLKSVPLVTLSLLPEATTTTTVTNSTSGKRVACLDAMDVNLDLGL